MAEPEKPKTNFVSWSVDDHRYDIDTYDIDGLEWRELKKVTGMSQGELLFTALRQQDFDAIGALIWIWRRRDEPELSYEDVLRPITYRSLRFELPPDEDSTDPPD